MDTITSQLVTRQLDEMGKKKGKSKKAAAPSLTNIFVPDWEAAKQKGNSLYGLCRYREALTYYSQAGDLLQKDTTTQNKSCELCKVYGNQSACYYQLYITEHPANKDLLQKALDAGLQAIAADSSYEKGHFRCAVALLKLGRTEEAVQRLTHVLDLYAWRGADYATDSLLLRTLAECKYMSAAKERSACWKDIKYKDNCVVVDAHGAGDFTSLFDCITKTSSKVSVLVKPGSYHITKSLLISDDRDVDIIGDIDDDQKPTKVTLFSTGSEFDPDCCNIFWVRNGAKLSLRNMSVRQESRHSERHGIFINIKAEATVTNCYGYSRSSGFLAVTMVSRLFLRECVVQEACGGVIVTSGSHAAIEHCSFKDCARIGVEVRDSGFAIVTDSELVNCGSQAIVSHASAIGLAVQRCILYGNAWKLSDQCSLMVAGGFGLIDDCQITCSSGGGVMVQDGAMCIVSKSRISGGKTGIGLTLQGSAHISDCQITNVHFGVAIVINRPGEVVMSGNTIKAKRADVMSSDDDNVPVMIGDTHHEVMINAVDLQSPHVKREILRHANHANKDHFVDETKWRDPRSSLSARGRICGPCGLSQQGSKKKYFKCSACRLCWYCSKECQTKDWPVHKVMCNKIQEVWKHSGRSESADQPAAK